MLDLDSYFARIGYDGPRTPTVETLRRLQLLHPIAIPFENLDSRHGRVPLLDIDALQAKLVAGRRGGYCFEQNGLFLQVLRQLGFRATPHLARVCWNLPEGEETGRGHMLLRVELNGEVWIADVGFGSITLTAPLRVVADIAQPTPHETFRLVRNDEGFEQQIQFDGGEWRPVYRFTLLHEAPEDFAMSNWYVATNPNSLFVQNLVLARATATGRITLGNTTLSLRDGGGAEKRTLATRAEMVQALRDTFGVETPDWATFDGLF